MGLLPKWLAAFKSTIQNTLVTDEQPLVVEQLILRLRRSRAIFTKSVDQLRTPKLLNKFLDKHPLIGVNNPYSSHDRTHETDQYQLDSDLTLMHSQMIQLGKDLQIHLSATIDRLHVMSVQFNMSVGTPQMPARARDLQQHIPILCSRLLADLVMSKEQVKANIASLKLEAQYAQDVYECFSELDSEVNELKHDMDAAVQLICATLSRMAQCDVQ